MKILTQKEEAYCLAYADEDSPTYKKKGASALAAGYPEPSAGQTATKLHRRSKVVDRITEIENAQYAEKYGVSKGTQLKEVIELRDKAINAGNFSAANAANDQINKYVGLYGYDVQAQKEQEELDETGRQSLERYEHFRHLEMLNPDLFKKLEEDLANRGSGITPEKHRIIKERITEQVNVDLSMSRGK